jgi:hypothetical protein
MKSELLLLATVLIGSSITLSFAQTNKEKNKLLQQVLT